MNTTKHTPGPWHAQPIEGPGHWQIIDPACLQIAMARHWPEPDGQNSPQSRAATEANAKLLAAAPDMLSSLREIAAQAELTARTFPNAPGRGDWLAVERNARAAIGRAEGA